MATIERFEEMMCWKKSRELVREIYKASSKHPLFEKDRGLKDQIQRSSVSVMSNIAEGFESGTKQEFINYLYIAKASAGEVRSQLYVAYDIAYLNPEIFKHLNGLAESCSKLIASFIRSLKGSSKAGLQYKREKTKEETAEEEIKEKWERIKKEQEYNF